MCLCVSICTVHVLICEYMYPCVVYRVAMCVYVLICKYMYLFTHVNPADFTSSHRTHTFSQIHMHESIRHVFVCRGVLSCTTVHTINKTEYTLRIPHALQYLLFCVSPLFFTADKTIGASCSYYRHIITTHTVPSSRCTSTRAQRRRCV